MPMRSSSDVEARPITKAREYDLCMAFFRETVHLPRRKRVVHRVE